MSGSAGATTLSLDTRGLIRALAVLEREQELFLPNPSEVRQARLLMAMTLVFGTLLATGVVGFIFAEVDLVVWLVLLAYPLNAILLWMACLLYLNLGLLRKLWHLERLRDELQLREVLGHRLRAEWRRRWGPNILKLLLAVLGVALIALPILFWEDLVAKMNDYALEYLPWMMPRNMAAVIAVAFVVALASGFLWTRFDRWLGHRRHRRLRVVALVLVVVAWIPFVLLIGAWLLVPGLNFGFTYFPGVPILGASLVSLYLIRIGQDRLGAVGALHDQLAGASTEESDDGTRVSQIPDDVYQAIAGLERNQIFLARQQSIRAAADEDRDSGFVIQRSQLAREALETLEPAARAAVEEAIFRLTLDATPEDARLDEESGRHRLAVSGTGAEIIYAVEPDACRIRIFAIDQPAQGAGG